MPTPKSTDGHVQPGDLVDLASRLRRFMSELETNAFLIEGSFERIGPDVEAAAAVARPVVQNAANRLFNLLEQIEKTPEYRRQKG